MGCSKHWVETVGVPFWLLYTLLEHEVCMCSQSSCLSRSGGLGLYIHSHRARQPRFSKKLMCQQFLSDFFFAEPLHPEHTLPTRSWCQLHRHDSHWGAVRFLCPLSLQRAGPYTIRETYWNVLTCSTWILYTCDYPVPSYTEPIRSIIGGT